MIKIAFKEPTTEDWLKWVEEALEATSQVNATVQGGQKPKFKDALYKRMREVYYDAFHGKCAYCERKFVLDQSGDIDHFRPKGAVTDENDEVVQVEMPGGRAPHPGYYWLAYHWKNLLPTCARCNRPTRLPSGKLVGKSTRFPVKAKAYAWQPGDEATEAPLFIHPMFDDPAVDLGLDPATGLIFARTPRGQVCIDKLDLNREGLPEERRRRYTEVRMRLGNAISAFQKNYAAEANEELATITAYASGTAELSWAGRIALAEGRPGLLAVLAAIDGSV